jgi:hypothetical protein
MAEHHYANPNRGENVCPRCREDRLRAWSELDEEQREVALKLPASSDYTLDERKALHRWCTRCWYEETVGESRTA